MPHAMKMYDFRGAGELDRHVRRHYRNRLPNGAISYYLLAMPELEKSLLGLCRPITANYQKLAEAGLRNPSKLKDVLEKLDGVLCEVEYGDPIKGGGKATVVRRYSLHELKKREEERGTAKGEATGAEKLAKALNGRTFTYGGQRTLRPTWRVLKTGRVQSSSPNVQGDPEKVRADQLAFGCGPGEVVHSLDFRQAEPTVIRHLMGWREDGDIYIRAAGLLDCSRQDAKGKVNMLAYCNSAVNVVANWPDAARMVFMLYAEKLDQYKEELWKGGLPGAGRRRHVLTVTGNRIEANRGDRTHRGKIMNWHVQGTVADITNAASLEIIEREAEDQWRFAFPCHDSAYVIARPEKGDTLVRIMTDAAERYGLPLEVRHAVSKRKQ